MNSYKQLDDLTTLEQMAENDPLRFLQDFENRRKNVDPIQYDSMDYLRAKALVALNQTEQAEELALEMLSHAMEKANYLQISRCNIILSRCYAASDDPSREKPYLDNAWEAARQAKDDHLIVTCLMLLGAWHERKGDEAKALDVYAKASRHIDAGKFPLEEAKLKLAEGTIYYHAEKYDKALPYLNAALDSAVRANDLGMQLLIINNLATLYSLMRKFQDAEAILTRGLKTAQNANMVMHVIRMTFNLGTLQLRLDNPSGARDKLEECASIAQSIGFADPGFLSELNSNLAGAYRYLGETQKAVQLLDEAEDVARTSLGTEKLKEIEINKANLLQHIGHVKESRELLRSVRKYYQSNKKLDQLTLVQALLAESYAAEERYDLALKYYRELHQTFKEHVGNLLSNRSPSPDYPLKAMITEPDSQTTMQDYRRRTTDRIPEFVGVSSAFKRALEAGLLAAQHPSANVLITGESGTGKDVLANIIHQHSVRRAFPFVAVNVSAVSSDLMESEFFGHKKGAFTSAVSEHNGYFIQANRGTLFLDEIGDMPVELQAKLLRALEKRKIIPVGGQKELAFDCRVISSTNRDINELMKRNLFRLDLLHRLNTIEIHIPPLRERPEDIELLAQHYLVSIAKETNRRVPKLDSSLMSVLKSHPFPGNVRELRNLIERLFIFNESDNWDADILGMVSSNRKTTRLASDRRRIEESEEREAIINALMLADGKQKEAAKLLSISESTLTRRIVKLRLQVYTRKGR